MWHEALPTEVYFPSQVIKTKRIQYHRSVYGRSLVRDEHRDPLRPPHSNHFLAPGTCHPTRHSLSLNSLNIPFVSQRLSVHKGIRLIFDIRIECPVTFNVLHECQRWLRFSSNDDITKVLMICYQEKHNNNNNNKTSRTFNQNEAVQCPQGFGRDADPSSLPFITPLHRSPLTPGPQCVRGTHHTHPSHTNTHFSMSMWDNFSLWLYIIFFSRFSTICIHVWHIDLFP